MLAASRLSILTLLAASITSAQEPTSQPLQNDVVNALVKGDIDAAIRAMETQRGVDADATFKAKFNADQTAFQNRTGNYRRAELIELALAGDVMSKETWLLFSRTGIAKFEFIYVRDDNGTLRLIDFRYNNDLWSLPWKP